jgi:hypothetical protein
LFHHGKNQCNENPSTHDIRPIDVANNALFVCFVFRLLGSLEIVRALHEKATCEDGSCGDKGDILGVKPDRIGVEKETDSKNVKVSEHSNVETCRPFIHRIQKALYSLRGWKNDCHNAAQNHEPDEEVEEDQSNLSPNSGELRPSMLEVDSDIPVIGSGAHG